MQLKRLRSLESGWEKQFAKLRKDTRHKSVVLERSCEIRQAEGGGRQVAREQITRRESIVSLRWRSPVEICYLCDKNDEKRQTNKWRMLIDSRRLPAGWRADRKRPVAAGSACFRSPRRHRLTLVMRKTEWKERTGNSKNAFCFPTPFAAVVVSLIRLVTRLQLA